MKKIMIFAAALAIMTSAAEARSAIPYVKQAAKHYGVPVSTAIKVCMVESRCRCNVRRGRAGEIGPMQVLPRTARGIRMSLKGCKNQVYAGVKYLRMALRAGGVWKYNQGTGAKRKSRAGAKYERMVRNARTR
jgi:soluble lytic murein transglycosylase-like protein